MGRGLSPLQRFILAQAAPVDSLYLYEIVRVWYGWPLTRNATKLPRFRTVVPMAHGLPIGSQKFSARRLGKAKYHAAMVTLSRAVQRLAARGLLVALRSETRHRTKAFLTNDGRLLVGSFCANGNEAVNR